MNPFLCSGIESFTALSKKKNTHIRPLVHHPEIKFILVSIRRLPLKRLNAFLFGMIILRSENIILMFLEDTELGSMGQLGSFFMVSSMK